jgi:hypothetical protein
MSDSLAFGFLDTMDTIDFLNQDTVNFLTCDFCFSPSTESTVRLQAVPEPLRMKGD